MLTMGKLCFYWCSKHFIVFIVSRRTDGYLILSENGRKSGRRRISVRYLSDGAQELTMKN